MTPAPATASRSAAATAKARANRAADATSVRSTAATIRIGTRRSAPSRTPRATRRRDARRTQPSPRSRAVQRANQAANAGRRYRQRRLPAPPPGQSRPATQRRRRQPAARVTARDSPRGGRRAPSAPASDRIGRRQRSAAPNRSAGVRLIRNAPLGRQQPLKRAGRSYCRLAVPSLSLGLSRPLLAAARSRNVSVMADLKLIALGRRGPVGPLGAPAGRGAAGRRPCLPAAGEALCRHRQPLRLGRRAAGRQGRQRRLCAPAVPPAFRARAGRPGAGHRPHEQERGAGPAGDRLRADRSAGGAMSSCCSPTAPPSGCRWSASRPS